jgi:ABC-type transporter Mla MlaB component
MPPLSRGVDVLKMTMLAQVDEIRTLKLEGELSGPWVEEVRQACVAPGVVTSLIRLDLSAVRFVDAVGVSLLRDLMNHGVEIGACSSFVAELLHLENS